MEADLRGCLSVWTMAEENLLFRKWYLSHATQVDLTYDPALMDDHTREVLAEDAI